MAKTSTERTSSLGLNCFEGAPSLMRSFHRHNDIEINFIASGAITYRFGIGATTLPARSYSLFWAAMPHQLVSVEPATHMFWVVVPLALFLRWELPGGLGKRVLDGKVLSSESSAIDETILKRWQDDIGSDGDRDEESQRIMLLELEARLRRFARDVPALDAQEPRPGKAASSVGMGKAERMSRFIAEHFTEPLRVEYIAKSVHIHPTYAMHLFRETFGVSIIDYLTQHRIAHAQQLLATSDHSVTEIALASGFNSVSRFYTAFNMICGKSPRAYREALR